MSAGTLSADGFMEYPCGCRICQEPDDEDDPCADCPGGCAHCGQYGPQETHVARAGQTAMQWETGGE